MYYGKHILLLYFTNSNYLCLHQHFFVEMNKTIAILVLNNIVFCLVLVLMCILVTFCISNPIAVKLHDIMTFS